MSSGPDYNPEWLARRAAWRHDWDAVRAFVEEASIVTRLKALLQNDPEKWVCRASITLGVYTSYEFATRHDLGLVQPDDLQSIQRLWLEAVEVIRTNAPDAEPLFRQYWDASVKVFAKEVGCDCTPTDYGFSDAT